MECLYCEVEPGRTELQRIVLLWVYYARLKIGGISMNNSEFYAYQYKEAKGGLSPEEKKKRNDLAYRFIMERRKTEEGRKSVVLSMIAVDYEDIQANASRNEWDEVRYKVKALGAKIKELCTRNGITGEEVKAYFARNNYSLSF